LWVGARLREGDFPEAPLTMRPLVGLFLHALGLKRGEGVSMRVAVVVGLVLGLVGCAVRHASPDGITIEHDAYQPELAAVEAEEHCAQYGKKAVLVKTSAPAPSTSLLYLNSSLSMYECVAE
jgi:hypothetical protein